MKITGLSVGEIRIPLRVPFRTALRSVTHVEDVALRLETDAGLFGYGEAPPVTAVTGETKATILRTWKETLAPALVGRKVEPSLSRIIQECCPENTAAKAAVETALYDLLGKEANLPLYRLLGGKQRTLTTDITVSVNPPESMAADTVEAVKRGASILKIKVGENPALDLERLQAVRNAAGPGILLRVDANQAWSPEEAIRLIREMAPLGLELVEQPVAKTDLEGLKRVTENVTVPILADEAVFGPEEAERVLGLNAAEMVNMKLAKCGGIRRGMEILRIAEKYGKGCMVGCMLEGPVGVTTAAHLALASPAATVIDLDPPLLCKPGFFPGGAFYRGTEITVPEAPGLGVDTIGEKVEWRPL